MHELQTRTEHSRNVEDAPLYMALHDLADVGFLLQMAEVETVHGRAGMASDVDWHVDHSFRSPSANANARPALYVGGVEVAKDFADTRQDPERLRAYYELWDTAARQFKPEQRLAWVNKTNKELREQWELSPRPDAGSNFGFGFARQAVPQQYTVEDFDGKRFGRTVEGYATEAERDAMWQRVREGLRAVAYSIISDDTDSMILNLAFDDGALTQSDAEKYKQALGTLADRLSVTDGAPVNFDDAASLPELQKELSRHDGQILSDADIKKFAENIGVDEQVCQWTCAAHNAREVWRSNPQELIRGGLDTSRDVGKCRVGTDGGEAPVNLEYVERLMRVAHIVGVQQNVESGTLGRTISVVSLFDLHRVNTKEYLDREKQDIWKRLGGTVSLASALTPAQPAMHLSSLLEQFPNGAKKPKHHHVLLRELGNAYAKPEALVAAAMKVEGFEELFTKDAGNWERYTLAEHTETVLRNFEENFADKVPVQLLLPMRLAILVHDLGKPAAAAKGQKHKQQTYNAKFAEQFMSKVGIDGRLSKLVVAIIGDGESAAADEYIYKNGKDSELQRQGVARKALREFSGLEAVPQEQITAFNEMCKILPICDGGAYTSMATTRTSDGSSRNYPSFNGSFKSPSGLGKRDLKYN